MNEDRKKRGLANGKFFTAVAICALFLGSGNVMAAQTASNDSQGVQEQMQSISVTVTVVDTKGEPIIGANVIEKGTTNGIITDIDGKFTLEVAPGAVVQVSYIGYNTQEVKVGNQSTLAIQLVEDTQALSEVVVVGYGVQRKVTTTGAVTKLEGDEINKMTVVNATKALQGLSPGITVVDRGGAPGSDDPEIYLRGVGTTGNAKPLVLVDGIEMSLSQIPSSEIENISVLKDAASASIYGSRAAHGVILVTTKRGKKDGEGVAISYQGSVSVSSIARKMDLLNAQEWTDTFMKGLENENKWLGTNWSLNRTDWFTDRNYFDANGNPIYDTDWQDEATRTAVSHNHQLNIQQAGKNSSMGAFLNYTDQQGIMLNTYNKRLNAKMAYDADPTKWLSTSSGV